jgi:hypothetical protein
MRHYNTASPHRALGLLAPAQACTRPPELINIAEHQIRRNKSSGTSGEGGAEAAKGEHDQPDEGGGIVETRRPSV